MVSIFIREECCVMIYCLIFTSGIEPTTTCGSNLARQRKVGSITCFWYVVWPDSKRLMGCSKVINYISIFQVALASRKQTTHGGDPKLFFSISERQAGKLWIPIFMVLGLTRPGIEYNSAVLAADALSTRPLIGELYCSKFASMIFDLQSQS